MEFFETCLDNLITLLSILELSAVLFGSTLGALHPRVAGLKAILKPLLVYLLVFIVELCANFALCLANVTA